MLRKGERPGPAGSPLQAGLPLFDDLVGDREQSVGNGETECLRGLQVEDQLEVAVP